MLDSSGHDLLSEKMDHSDHNQIIGRLLVKEMLSLDKTILTVIQESQGNNSL
jgi:hypothetical protein